MTDAASRPFAPSLRRRGALLISVALLGALVGGCVSAGAGGVTGGGGMTGGGATPAGASASPGDGSASPTVPAIALPGNPDTVLIQVRNEGGFVPPDYRFTAFPMLTIYADGRVFQLGAQTAIYPQPLLPPVLVGHVSSAQLQVLLAAADAASLRTGKDAAYPPHGIADAPDTALLVWSPTGTTRTSFGALGMEQSGVDAAEAAAREAATTFISKLTASDLVGSSTAYVPSMARLVVREYTNPSPDLPQTAVEWPLATSLAGAGSPVLQGSPESGRCLVLSSPELTTVWPLLEKANGLTPFRSAGKDYAVVVRPLLPAEEAVCGAS